MPRIPSAILSDILQYVPDKNWPNSLACTIRNYPMTINDCHRIIFGLSLYYFVNTFSVIPQVIFLLCRLETERAAKNAPRMPGQSSRQKPRIPVRWTSPGKSPRPSAASDIGHPFVQRTEAKIGKKCIKFGRSRVGRASTARTTSHKSALRTGNMLYEHAAPPAAAAKLPNSMPFCHQRRIERAAGGRGKRDSRREQEAKLEAQSGSRPQAADQNDQAQRSSPWAITSPTPSPAHPSPRRPARRRSLR